MDANSGCCAGAASVGGVVRGTGGTAARLSAVRGCSGDDAATDVLPGDGRAKVSGSKDSRCKALSSVKHAVVASSHCARYMRLSVRTLRGCRFSPGPGPAGW